MSITGDNPTLYLNKTSQNTSVLLQAAHQKLVLSVGLFDPVCAAAAVK